MMRSGPHQTTIGKRDARQVAMAALSVSGQHAGGPSGECDQSWARIRAPILPPPSRKPTGVGPAIDMHNPPLALRLDDRPAQSHFKSRAGHGATKLGLWKSHHDR